MISVSQAKNSIQQHSKKLTPKLVALKFATGLQLAEAVFANNNFPAFPQSAMDGYAFAFNDWQQNGSLQISQESAAGNSEKIILKKNQAVRIFTGAPVPEGADTVVMQEKVNINLHSLTIADEKLQIGNNIRPIGSEMQAGELALAKGTFLSAAAIGFLAGIGKTEVLVYPKPNIAIIVTGKELQHVGKPLQYGQVYESNSYTLAAALQQIHITNVTTTWVDDDLYLIEKALQQAVSTADIVLVTGGVSVGDYDFVTTALATCNVEKLFHKVKQKPGKPLYFGKQNNTLVFGLPGNPSSVLTCFYEYVIPALQILMGLQQPFIKSTILPLAIVYKKPAGLTHFLKGIITENEVMPLTAQESYRLKSFAVANCLIVINEDISELQKGDKVEVHVLPN